MLGGIFQNGEGLRFNLRREGKDAEPLSEVKLQLPPFTPVAFTVSQEIFEEKKHGIGKLEEESDV